MNPANVQKWGKESTHHGKCWLFFFDIMACLNIWSSFMRGLWKKCGITEFIAGSITISSIVPETVEHPQTTFPPLCFTAGMKRLLSAFAWDKNICCYCSQKPLSLIHLSRVHFSKQPDLWLYVHCQTLVSLSCSLRFFLACLPCQSNMSLSHVTHDLWHQQMRLYLHDDEVVFLFTLQKACFYVLGGMPVMDKLAVIWNFHHF